MPVPSVFQGHKVAFVGDSGVGKSTIFSVLTGEKFSSCYVKTKDRVILTKNVRFGNGQLVRLQLWDTPGSDECRTYTTHSLENVKGILLVFDVSNEESFRNVSNWIKVVHRYIEQGDEVPIPILLVANKIDKIRNRKVKEEQVQQLVHQYSIQCIETSAKTGHNIERVGQSIAEELLKRSNTPTESTLPSRLLDPPPDDSIFSHCSIL